MQGGPPHPSQSHSLIGQIILNGDMNLDYRDIRLKNTPPTFGIILASIYWVRRTNWGERTLAIRLMGWLPLTS